MVTAKKIFWTEAAREDLFKIFRRIEGKGAKNQAIEVVNQILSKTAGLNTQYPQGTTEPLLKNEKEPYSFVMAGFYKIVYSVVGDQVVIKTLYHQRQDPTVG
ncbi:MAG: hypothetical protein OHK0053_35240 [Microscillaceae bacterium]